MRFRRLRRYQFPKVPIQEIALENEFWDQLDLSAEMFKGHDKLHEFGFGAWSEQFKVNPGRESTTNMSQIIDDLIGIMGMKTPSSESYLKYAEVFKNHEMFEFNLKSLKKDLFKYKHLLTDLGSVLDLITIRKYCSNSDIRVLEVGGGYGRLAESAFHNSGIFEKWYLVDVVPSSLALAGEFLRRNNVSVGFGSESSFVQLLQVKDLECISDNTIDLAINIELFQEMNQNWVNFWISQINQKCKPGAVFYHSNSFGYKNSFTINLGEKWRLEASFESPRHWTPLHRSEIWRKIS